jgi:hypothetical protein
MIAIDIPVDPGGSVKDVNRNMTCSRYVMCRILVCGEIYGSRHFSVPRANRGSMSAGTALIGLGRLTRCLGSWAALMCYVAELHQRPKQPKAESRSFEARLPLKFIRPDVASR